MRAGLVGAGAGVAVALGGIGRDAIGVLADQGYLGSALVHPATGYAAVYAIEIALLVLTLVVMRSLVAPRRPAQPPTAPPRTAGVAP